MKTQSPLLKLLLLLLSLWAWPHSAHAYYDPGVQRWINRDPITEIGFNLHAHHDFDETEEAANKYRFASNSSCNRVDPYGLSDDPFFDLLKMLKNALDKLPDDPKGFCGPCASVNSGRALCDCAWNELQKLKGNPSGADNVFEEMAKCFCVAADGTTSDCVRKMKNKIKAFFSMKD